MPAWRTVYEWMEQDAAFSAAITQAREVGFDAIALDGLKIADDVAEDPASRRVRTDYRLKLLAKWDPKRYGDLLKLGNPDGTNFDLKAAVDASRLKAGIGG
jgi:hypothetical protein